MTAWDGEEWRPVVGHVGFYDVSNLGRVRRVAPGKGAIIGALIKCKPDRKGYLCIQFSIKGRAIYRKVHALVAEAFIGPRPPGALVLHRDDNKANNTPGNLYYGSHRENVADAKRNGTFAPGKRKDGAPRGSAAGRKKCGVRPTPEQVREARRLAAEMSCIKAARILGISKSSVHRIATRRAYADVG